MGSHFVLAAKAGPLCKRPILSNTLLRFPPGCAVSQITKFGWIPTSSSKVQMSATGRSVRLELPAAGKRVCLQ